MLNFDTMKRILFVVLGLLAWTVSHSQTAFSDTSKWSYGVQVGTSATFAGKYGSGVSAYVAPHVTWQPSKRFRVNAGFSVVNTTLFNYTPWYYGLETGNAYSGNYTHALLYAEGEYLLTKDLTVSGSLYAEIPLTGGNPSNPFSTSSFKGGSVDFQYRIGPNSVIRAGFNYIRNEGPLYDPFRTPAYPYTTPWP